MVSSGRYPEQEYEILTSSGVLVRDNHGYQYMTVAAHGFRGLPFQGKVYHPHAWNSEIGEAIIELSYTDVALVKLNEGVHFINESFENALLPAPALKLVGFSRATETRMGDDIFLDSPYTGFVEGTRGAYSLPRIPSDDPHEPVQEWIQCRWDYMGQGSSSQMTDGVCGSAIWNKDSKVLGFSRYAPKSGRFLDWCISVTADHLIEKGYSMV